jgi:transcription termination factor NusB
MKLLNAIAIQTFAARAKEATQCEVESKRVIADHLNRILKQALEESTRIRTGIESEHPAYDISRLRQVEKKLLELLATEASSRKRSSADTPGVDTPAKKSMAAAAGTALSSARRRVNGRANAARSLRW